MFDKLERWSLLIIIFSIIVFNSCGLSDDPMSESNVYDIADLESGCELNTDKLNKILDEDITKDINCLKDNIDQYVQFVRRKDPQHIEESELKQFINKFFPEDKDSIGKLITLVFKINTLLLRDPNGKISINNLSRFFNLFYSINDHGRILKRLFLNIDKNNYWSRRLEIFQKTEALSRDILRNIITSDTTDPELEVLSFIREVKEALDLNDDQINLRDIESFLFTKKLFLGGVKNQIKYSEVVNLLSRSSDLLLLGMDILYQTGKSHSNKMEEYYFYYDIVSEIKGHLVEYTDTELIMDHEDLLVVLDNFIGDKYDIQKMNDSILTIKKKFFGGAPDKYVMRDIVTILNWGLEFSGMLYFNEVTYNHYSDLMNSPEAIEKLSLPKLAFYDFLPSWMIKKLWENFEFISKNYRFFQDDDGRTHFLNYYKRFKSGYQIASMLRWAITKVVQVYGHFPPGKRRKETDQDDLKKLFTDLEGVVKELNLWPEQLDKFISEAIAMADLFMFNSDGNDSVSSEELTEYAANALHAFSIGDIIHTNLKNHCEIIDEDTESFDVSCFRENILTVFFDELNYQTYYEKLYEYLNLNGRDEVRDYIINIELYSRVENSDEVPITKEDLNRILVILTNLESTYLRFDADKDGILNRAELDMAFLVFKNLIIKVANIGDSADGLYKSIFLFLIKEMDRPTSLELIWFHIFGNKKNITSSRFNISAILKNFTIE